MRRIGIDVGGTNTDAVLLEDGRIVHAVKTPTTADVTAGIVAALGLLSRHPEVARGRIDGAGMREAARRIRDSGLRSVAVAASFSPLDPSHEERARKILAEECPDAHVTLSHELGRIGLLERENAALLNAALIDLARVTI